MKVTIYSREEMEQLLDGGFPAQTAVISFSDPPVSVDVDSGSFSMNFDEKVERLFQVEVLDIHFDELKEYEIDYEDFLSEAEELAQFIVDTKVDGWDIICQCEYGQSRSAGCAAAILEFYYNNGISIFADYRYCPNQMIFHKVYDALRNLTIQDLYV